LTRFITLIWAVIQSVSLALYLKQIFDWNYNLAFEIVAWLTTGAMIVLWLSELITDYGLGMVHHYLYTNIISSLPNLTKKYSSKTVKVLLFSGVGIALLIFASLYGIVFYKKEFELFH
jgi:preprotein translocase subunit SecY